MKKEIESLISDLTTDQKASLVCGKGAFESASIPSQDIRGLIFSDGSQGIRKQRYVQDHLGMFPSIPSTCFPAASTLACSWDKKLMFRIGEAMGKEAASLKVDVLLAPAINMMRHPMGGRNFEYFSEDPCLAGELASSMIQGIQKTVSACPKHFLLNSQETFRMSVDEQASMQSIMEYYLPAFERVIKQSQPDWIMSAYNKVNGEYASENAFLLKEILRKQLGFQGAVMSDWGGGNDIIKAIRAGSTLEMPATNGQSKNEILKAVEEGRLEVKDLDKRAAEMLEAIQKADQRIEERKGSLKDQTPSYRYHHQLAFAAARKSAVLLKNDDNILPLDPMKRVCFIGDFEHFPIQGNGSAAVNPKFTENFKVIAKKYLNIPYKKSLGYRLHDESVDSKLELRAISAAKKADVIIVLAAFPLCESTEGLDRRKADLPENQKHLIQSLAALNKPIILIDAIAGAIELSIEPLVQGILYTGLSGQSSLEAMFSLLFGEFSPSGKLAFSFACHMDDHLVTNFPQKEPISYHSEQTKVGYRYFHTEHIPVRYPFGYGLSYTEFHLNFAGANKDGICFEIENVGNMDGDGIIQLYRKWEDHDEVSSEEVLVGFERIHLKKGQIKKGFIPFDEYTFRRYLPQSKRFAILKGEVNLKLAWNIEEPIWSTRIFLKDGEDVQPEVETNMPVHYRKSAWKMDLETPLEEFAHSPNRAAAKSIEWLIAYRDRSLKKNSPNLAVCALLSMPLKSICKLYPDLMNFDKAQALIDQMNEPSESGCSELIRLIHTVFKKDFSNSKDPMPLAPFNLEFVETARKPEDSQAGFVSIQSLKDKNPNPD